MLAITLLLHKIEKREESLFYALLSETLCNAGFNYRLLIREYHGEKFPLATTSWDLKEYIGEKAMKTAFHQLGYVRRTSKKKGFPDDPRHNRLRYEFAQAAVRWSHEQVYNQIFSDEIWANGGAYTTSYVTVKGDGSDRYLGSNVQQKYSKCPAWMFHGTIHQGRKWPAVCWEKAWGSIDSAKYDQYILPRIQALVETHPGLTYDEIEDLSRGLRSWRFKWRPIIFINYPKISL